MNKVKSFLKSDRLKDHSQFWIVLFLILTAVIISFSMKYQKESIVVDSRDAGLLRVEVNRIVAKQSQVVIRDSASVQADTPVNITPQVGGRVIDVSPNSRSGSAFDAEEVLFRIDPADFQYQLNIADAAVKNARKDLMLAKVDSEAARLEWKLLNPDKQVPPLVAREPQLLAANAALQAAEAEVAKAKLNLNRTVFSFKKPGKIVSSQIEFGQLLVAGQPYGQAFLDDSVEIIVELSSEQLNWIRVGSKALILKGSKSLPATVSRISASLNPDSRLAQVFIEPETLDSLIVGEFVEVEIMGITVDAAYKIPMECFQDDNSLWLAVDNSKGSGDYLLEKYTPEVLAVLENEKLVLAAKADEELLVICQKSFDWQEGRRLEVVNNE